MFIFLFLQVMSRLGVWGLDVFLVSDLSDERPLTVTTYTIFQVIKVYQLSSVKQMFWIGETRNTTSSTTFEEKSWRIFLHLCQRHACFSSSTLLPTI